MEGQSQIFEVSPIHQSTQLQVEENYRKGLYYNSTYEIENFIQVHQDHAKGDPFKVLLDSTFTGFKLFFHFDATSGLFADETYPNSALAYLLRLGLYDRYELLKRFIVTLSKVNSITPWLFQEITGLKEVYQNERKNPLQLHEIEIKTLETVDHKIHSLIEMYRNISFDYNRWVDILPENLRTFSMSIYVYDFRVFDHTSSTAVELLQTVSNTDIRKLNHTMFDLGNCTFKDSSGGSFFESVSNNPTVETENNISIQVENVSLSSMFRSITGNQMLNATALEVSSIALTGQLQTFNQQLIGQQSVGQNINGPQGQKTILDPSTGKLISRSNFVDRILNTDIVNSAQNRKNEYQDLINGGYKRELRNIVNEGALRLQQRAEAELTRLYLGNVNGFGFDDLIRLNQDNDFRTAFAQIYGQTSNTRSLELGNVKRSSLGNIND